MSHGAPAASHRMLPPHRSPCSRAGGSGGPASSGRRSQTRSTARAPTGEGRGGGGRRGGRPRGGGGGEGERGRRPPLAVERRPVLGRLVRQLEGPQPRGAAG